MLEITIAGFQTTGFVREDIVYMKRRRKKMTTLDYMRQNVKWGMLAFAIIFILGIFIGPGFGSYGSMQCGKNKAQMTQQEYYEQQSEVIATMGDEEFKEYTIGREYAQRLEYYRAQSPTGTIVPPEDLLDLKWNVLSTNIENKLKIYKANLEGIKVTNKEIDDKYNEYKKSQTASIYEGTAGKNLSLLQHADLYIQGKKAERDFVAVLHQSGLTPEKLRTNIRESLLVQKYDSKLEKQAKDEVNEEARKEAITLYNRIVTDKEDFIKIVREASDDTTSAQKDGLVENMTRKDAKAKSDAFATALFTGEIGKVQEPIKTEDSFYIVKVEKRVLAEGSEYEKAKPGIIEELKKELGITDEAKKDESGQEKTGKDETSSTTESKDATSETKPEADESKKITEDQIKERFEKVNFRQILVRPESYYQRLNDNVEKMKSESNIEILDPMLKAYSYVAGFGETKNYDKAIEEFRAYKSEKQTELETAKSELAQKESELQNASEDKKIDLESEVSTAQDKLFTSQTMLAQADYLIAHFLKSKIDDINQKREQEFNDKKNKEPEKYKDAQPPQPSAEELAKFAEMKKEMRTLIEEAVALLETPEPYYNAMLGELYVEAGEWVKAHEQWAIIVDYVHSDPQLLERANTAYNQFMDKITDPAIREKIGQEYDKLQKNLTKARAEQQKLQEEQQKRFQEMIQEQMKKQEEAKKEGSGTADTEESTS